MKGLGKRGAIELSIGTVVIIVLAMTMLILGLVLVRTIFSGATTSVDNINSQVQNEINKIFGEDKKLVIYPSTDFIMVRQGKVEGFALGIQNLLSGSLAQGATFDYKVIPVSNFLQDCGLSEQEVMELFSAGSSEESNIPIATGTPTVRPVFFETGEGTPLCTIKFRVDVSTKGQNYDTAVVFVKFVAK